MIFHISGLHSSMVSFRNTIIQDVMEVNEFKFGKTKSFAEQAERTCNLTSIILCIFYFLTLLSYLPFFGDCQNLPTAYLVQKTIGVQIITNFTFVIGFILILYAQFFPILTAFYVAWIAHIHYFRLNEYIDTHLCKKYDNFNIIKSKYEQDLIYFHLRKCAKFHLLLKR